MTPKGRGLLAGLFLILFALGSPAYGFESAKVMSVVDGATIVLSSGEVVGYAGVRIPTTEPQTAARAAAYNESLVGGAEVRLEYDVEKRDAAGRLLAYVYVGRLFVNKELVDLGFAEVDTETENIKYRKLLFRGQKEAFERRRGLWAERFGVEGAERVEVPEMPAAEVPVAAGLPVSLPDEERPLTAVDVTPRIFIGDVFTYTFMVTAKLTSAGEETQEEAQQEGVLELTAEVVATVEDVDPKGGAKIRQDIVRIEASAMAEDVSQEDVERMGLLAGKSVTVTLDANGEIAGTTGQDELLAETPPVFRHLLYPILSAWESPLPHEKVRLGDVWWLKRPTPSYAGGAQVNMDADAKRMVTDFARVGPYRCAEISMEGTAAVEGLPAGSGQVASMSMDFRITEYFAYDEGFVVRAEGEMESAATLSVAGGPLRRQAETQRVEFVLQEVRRGENYVAQGQAPTEMARTVYVAKDAVNLRKGAAKETPALARLERGEKLTVLARKGEWYKVRYTYPVWGWVSSDLVQGEVSEELLLKIPEEAPEWAEPSEVVAEADAPPEMRERVVFYAEAQQVLKEREVAAAAAEAPEGMVYVPAGSFLMGSDAGDVNVSPQHEVSLDAFYIDRCEVTNKDFQAFRPDFMFAEGQGAHPVSGVSWEEANAYCEWAGKHLPTEVEWEKAARGMQGLIYPWGNTFEPERANTAEAEKKGTVPVGQYSGGASPYGAYDMTGNAAEWVASWYQAYPGNSSPDPDYGETFKVLRGGSWFTPKEQSTALARLHDNPNNKQAYYGFRCAVSSQQLAALARKKAEREAAEARQVAKPEAPPVEEVPEGFVGRFMYMVQKLIDRVMGLLGR